VDNHRHNHNARPRRRRAYEHAVDSHEAIKHVSFIGAAPHGLRRFCFLEVCDTVLHLPGRADLLLCPEFLGGAAVPLPET